MLALRAQAAPGFAVRFDQNLCVIGDVFDRAATRTFSPTIFSIEHIAADDPVLMARQLVERAWGSYVAFLDIGTDAPSLFCDPSGGFPLRHASGDGLDLFADDIPSWLADAVGIERAVDWQALVHTAVHVPVAAHQSLLAGIRKLLPGQLYRCRGGEPAEMLWAPHLCVSMPHGGRELGETLRDDVTAILGAWCKGPSALALELSGGMDSAIIACASAHLASRPPLIAITYAPPDAAADERTLARLSAAKARATLIEVPADPAELRYSRFAASPLGAEPRIAWLDPIQDEVSERAAQALGTDRVLTGQGGDALFFQFPSATPVADLIHETGLASSWPEALRAAAMRRHCSIWGCLGELIRARRRAPPPRTGLAAYLGAEGQALAAAPVPRHPWEIGADGLPPGKRLQISGIAHCQLFQAPAWPGSPVRRIHPLLSQPLVERALAIPTWRLVDGPIDRTLARRAFARWLPDAVTWRPAKGDASAYYNRAVVENLPYLRSLLLDGLLVARGILDRSALDRLATPDTLIVSRDYGALVLGATLELWARAWS
ncbi:asparagine synthase-related protein [Flavisphingomonas formosensis]|uniref:asparagine synthase-related protein n=1 Tax=Flavisphingomonas formosensis TaxID=861534 RepID=UPI0018E0205E|nr:asparagine synthetase B family protein [Sphingomonas formosensis]